MPLPWGKKCFIVAEIGANHHQSFQRAITLVRAAKAVGADAVKIQMFTPEQMCLNDGSRIKEGPWSGIRLYELYKKAAMPMDWVPKLCKTANDEQILLFPTVYHPDIISTAEEMEMPLYKISSFEITWPEFIEKVASTKKPLIISTGSAEFNEIKTVVRIVKKHHSDFALLKCTSEYPAPIEKMNIRTMTALGHVFRTEIGLSDHTTGIVAPVVAVSLGAVIIEKHLTLDGKGLDGGFSILPDRFLAMVKTIRAAEAALGKIDYGGRKTFHRQMVNGEMVRVVA